MYFQVFSVEIFLKTFIYFQMFFYYISSGISGHSRSYEALRKLLQTICCLKNAIPIRIDSGFRYFLEMFISTDVFSCREWRRKTKKASVIFYRLSMIVLRFGDEMDVIPLVIVKSSFIKCRQSNVYKFMDEVKSVFVVQRNLLNDALVYIG